MSKEKSLKDKSCRKCGVAVARDLPKCHDCGAIQPSRSHLELFFGTAILVAIAFFLIKAIVDARRQPNQYDSVSGVHCLSPWTGSHAALNKEIKSSLRDPKSFEHVKTVVSEKKPDGKHLVLVEYRARNGFGGMNVSTARGRFDSETCRHELLAIE